MNDKGLNLAKPISQEDFAALVGIAQPTVSGLIRKGILRKDDTAATWLHLYCARLREQAAGRAANGDLDLATERARLAREQADIAALKKGQLAKTLAPVSMLTAAIAKVAAQLASALDALPSKIKMRCPELSSAGLDVVREEISNARNLAADMTIDLGDTAEQGSEESDPKQPVR